MFGNEKTMKRAWIFHQDQTSELVCKLICWLEETEIIREQKRMVDRSVRDLTREKQGMERTEQQLINDIRKAAKAGQVVRSCFVTSFSSFDQPNTISLYSFPSYTLVISPDFYHFQPVQL